MLHWKNQEYLNALITVHTYGAGYKKFHKNMKASGGIPVKTASLAARKSTTKILKQ